MMMTGKTDDELQLLLLYRRVKGKQIKASSDVKHDVFLTDGRQRVTHLPL